MPVHVLGTEATSQVRASRYCTWFHAVGTHDGIAGRWLDPLEAGAATDAVLLPTADEGVELGVRHRDRLRELGYRLLDHPGETSLSMLDRTAPSGYNFLTSTPACCEDASAGRSPSIRAVTADPPPAARLQVSCAPAPQAERSSGLHLLAA